MFDANAYVIEVHGVAAGLIVRGERGRSYRFVADDPRFALLNGNHFPSPQAAQSSVARHLESLERRTSASARR